MGDLEFFYEDITILDHKEKEKRVKELTVNLFNNNHEIPLLIIFANKLMKIARDLYEEIEVSDKFHALSNFFELFYHLSEAGPEMKRYMVHSKFIGRLLDIYNYKTSINKHYNRDLSGLPTFEIFCNNGANSSTRQSSSKNVSPEDIESTEEPELKFNYALSVIKKSKEKDDLIVEKEKGKTKADSDEDDYRTYGVSKNNREGDEKRFAYLLRAISNLVCSCRFKISGRYIAEDSLFLNSAEPNELRSVEDRIIEEITSEEVINDLVIRSNLAVGTKEAINDMYAHLCWENEEISNRLLKILIADL
jgi:hypothetical protein